MIGRRLTTQGEEIAHIMVQTFADHLRDGKSLLEVGQHQAHQQRALDEKNALDEKLDRLRTFISANPTFKTLPDNERRLLGRQFEVMAEYSSILSQRIAAFSA
jgi:hypothetical protein